MAAMFSKQQLSENFGLYASDIVTLPVIAGAAARTIADGRGFWKGNPLAAPFFAIVVYFGLTVLWADQTGPAFINWLRHLQLILLCLLISDTVKQPDIPRLLGLMLVFVFLLSFYVMSQFVTGGGRQREFGPTGWFFTTFLAMAITHATVGVILVKHWWSRFAWIGYVGVCSLALFASMTRSAMIQATVGVVSATMLTWYWASRHGERVLRRRIMGTVILLAAVAVVFLSGAIPVFRTSAGRVTEALQGRSVTINTRLFLWKMGFSVFVGSPILGVGLGQAAHWSDNIPTWRLDPSSMAGRLGVHNDLIRYLAETGLVGITLIFWLFVRVTKMGITLIRHAGTLAELFGTLILVAPTFAIMVHISYGADLFWSIGGMIVAFYFGMLSKKYQDVAVSRGLVHPS